jgi:hypothetical protein
VRRSKRQKGDDCYTGASAEEDIDTLILCIFSMLVQGYWWKVLPDEDSDHDICIGTGRDWEQLLPLLLVRKYVVVSRESRSISKYSIMRTKIDSLCHAVSAASGTKLQSACYQKTVTINGKSSLASVSTGTYLCLGKPVHSKPELQIKSKATPNLELCNNDLDLSQRITHFCRKINGDDLIHRIEEEIKKRVTASTSSGTSSLSIILDAIVGYTSNKDDEQRPSDTAGAAAASLPEELVSTGSALLDKAEQQMLFAEKLNFE